MIRRSADFNSFPATAALEEAMREADGRIQKLDNFPAAERFEYIYQADVDGQFNYAGILGCVVDDDAKHCFHESNTNSEMNLAVSRSNRGLVRSSKVQSKLCMLEQESISFDSSSSMTFGSSPGHPWHGSLDKLLQLCPTEESTVHVIA